MLQPKRVLRRNRQKGRIKGKAQRGYWLAFGCYGLKVLEPTRISAAQIETIRVILTREAKKSAPGAKNTVYRRIFPDRPITSKPAEVRMGKGKGGLDHWVAIVRPGTIIFELSARVSEAAAKKAVHMAGKKLGVKTCFTVDNTLKSFL